MCRSIDCQTWFLSLLVDFSNPLLPTTASFPGLEAIYPKKSSSNFTSRRVQPPLLTPSWARRKLHLSSLWYTEISTNIPPLFNLLVNSKILEFSWSRLKKCCLLKSHWPDLPTWIEPWKLPCRSLNAKEKTFELIWKETEFPSITPDLGRSLGCGIEDRIVFLFLRLCREEGLGLFSKVGREGGAGIGFGMYWPNWFIH